MEIRDDEKKQLDAFCAKFARSVMENFEVGGWTGALANTERGGTVEQRIADMLAEALMGKMREHEEKPPRRV